MGRVTIFENPADNSDFQEFKHTGPFIDFLLEQYPNGFGGRSHVTAFNGSKLAVEDYDRQVSEKDHVWVVVLPGIETAVLVKIVVGVLVSTVLNFAINKFFGPKGTKPTSPIATSTNGLPAASPTYSLNVPTNVARLGQPIPVPYGNNLLVPDLAATPYSVYRNNQQYVNLLLCLGQGKYSVSSVSAANTDVSSLGSGVISQWQFDSSQHLKTFGTIQNYINASNSGQWTLYENVYTVADVSDQEFVAPAESGGTTDPYLFSGCSLYNTLQTNYDKERQGGWVLTGRQIYEFVGYANLWMTVAAPAANAGIYKVLWVNQPPPIEYRWNSETGMQEPWYYDEDLGEWVPGGYSADAGYLIQLIVEPVDILEEDRPFEWPEPNNSVTVRFYTTEPTTIEPDPEAPTGVEMGPYIATPRGIITSYLQYDYVFPNGCYSVHPESGDILPMEVTIIFLAEPIGLTDETVTGAGYQAVITKTMATTTAQRLTHHHRVPSGRYRVKGYRTTPKASSARGQSSVYWTGLKAVLGNTEGGQVYGDVTLVAIVAKATEGLSTDALSRISVRCTRYDPTYGTLTRNPADAFRDIFTNLIYGGRRPVAELDWPTYEAAKTRWTNEGRTFDAVFDTQTTLWEAMGMSLQGVHTSPTMSGALLTLVEDKDHTVPYYVLDEDSIKTLALTFLFPEGEEVDGVEVEYRDPNDNAALYVYYPSTTVNPEKVVLFGCRDETAALAYATQRWKQLSLRRLLVTVETELDAEIIPVGSPVEITHPNLNSGAPTLCIANAITSSSEFGRTIEFHRHESGVFS